MREYTVLLDPPVYTPGETASSAAPVTAPTVTAAAPTRRAAPAPAAPPPANRAPAAGPSAAAAPEPATPITGNSYRVAKGDTLTKIARSLRANVPAKSADIDQTMMAVYRANPMPSVGISTSYAAARCCVSRARMQLPL